ncbi:MAG: PQQ-dependent dehydrogenase, methanol/ethanol family [Gemmatimonadota bacterium]
MRIPTAAAAALALALSAAGSAPLWAQGGDGGTGPAPAPRNPAAGVTFERIVRAPAAEPGNWLTYYGGYAGQRFSLLDQVDTASVSRLEEAWSRTWPIQAKFEATPLVVDGTMYLSTGGETQVFALDAATGRELWSFKPPVNVDIAICCGHVNRGVAVAEGKVFVNTLDAVLYALDAATGRVVWRRRYADPAEGYSATVAPLVVKDMVVTGISGGEYGIRGFVDAFDLDTGERRWRFWTVPGPGEPGHDTWGSQAWRTGGGPTWITGTYDPELDLLYWGVGNPGPDLNGEVRPGDNLYTSGVVALDPDDGRLRWHFQFTPHDVWDYDGMNVMTLADLEVSGRPTRALLHADKNGYFYALDRATGKFLYAVPFARQTWTTGIDPRTGRPVVNPEAVPAAHDRPVCPSSHGASEWVHMAYSPATRMAYVPVMEQCAVFRTAQAFYVPGLPFFGGTSDTDAFGPAEAHGFLRAIDATTGREAWAVRTRRPVDAAVLATAGGLVFWRENDGLFHATHARTGEDLWTHRGGGGTRGSVMTYLAGGAQYVAWTAVTPGHEKHHRLVAYRLPRG